MGGWVSPELALHPRHPGRATGRSSQKDTLAARESGQPDHRQGGQGGRCHGGPGRSGRARTVAAVATPEMTALTGEDPVFSGVTYDHRHTVELLLAAASCV